ncbi:MAG: ABC transporter ATP-binding protein [Rhodospirillales bacterium]|nr:ABC transporter ATP-binding protein [Rhodospirillales bacterium]MDE0379735.1 ABC transporter ATP-binding protein [Rhodospirillales bacterium]
MSAAPETVLATHALTAFYSDFQALFGIDLHVARGETVAIIGANGAGKSTFLKSVVGQLASQREQVSFEGEPIGHLPAHEIVRRGIALVPEGRLLFPSLSVEENLRLGAYGKRAGPWRIERVHELFPVLRERRATPGTALSGGEQQMCAIGRALMSNPTLLLCDELSLGLAPVIIRQLYAVLPVIVSEGTTVVVVEQDINQALSVADRVYCFQEGRVSLQGKPDELSREDVATAYFGV